MYFTILVVSLHSFVPRPHIDRTRPHSESCKSWVNENCASNPNDMFPRSNAPVRECPEHYVLGTVRSGARYCVPDRTVGQ